MSQPIERGYSEKENSTQMADVRKSVECEYCGVTFHIKYPEDEHAQFCCFCGESFDSPGGIKDEDDDGDLDYDDQDRDETEV